jgi:hypothetical protein
VSSLTAIRITTAGKSRLYNPDNMDKPGNSCHTMADQMEVAMFGSHARRPTGRSPSNLISLKTADVIEIIGRRNPDKPRAAVKVISQITAALSASAAKLSPDQQQVLLANKRELPEILAAVLKSVEIEAPVPLLRGSIRVQQSGSVEESRGTGLGEKLSHEEGLHRVAAYVGPRRIEDWAGPVLGPSDLEREYGIKRSTLHEWQQRGAVIGLLKGERKHVFPVDQFVDGRPVQGMSRVMKIIQNPRAAWLWLTRPHPNSEGRPPLDLLKDGRVDAVVAAAEGSFG